MRFICIDSCLRRNDRRVSYKLEISKIVGVSDQENWAQVHVFLPEDRKKKKQWGDLIAIFAFRAKVDNLEIPSFGREIIQRFHETYYSSKIGGILERLKEVLERVKGEFADKVDLQITVAVVIDGAAPAVYLAGNKGEGRLFRKPSLVNLLFSKEKIRTVSGFLEDRDIFIVGSRAFFEKTPNGVLRPILAKQGMEQIKEDLSAHIGAQKENNQVAAVVVHYRKVSSLPEREKEEAKKKKGWQPSFFSKIPFPDFSWAGRIINERVALGKKKKVNLTVAVILIFLLLASVFLGFKKRSLSGELETQKKTIEKARSKYEQALGLVDLSPARAKSLFIEAKQELESYKGDKEIKEINQLLAQVEGALEDVSREYRQEEGKLFFDLSLIKEGFSGESLSLAFPKLAILGSRGTILELDLQNKQGKILAGGEKLQDCQKVAKISAFTFGLEEDELLMIEDETGEVIDKKKLPADSLVANIGGFASNAYLLTDKQILKFVGLDEGFSDKREYLKEEDDSLESGISLAIDGSVWVLTNKGEVFKFVRGKRDFFVVSGLDQPFGQVAVLFTDQHCDDLYILDRRKTRVVVISKEGEYKASYVWPGIAGVTDMVASEELGKIFLLAGEKIYEIELKGDS